MSLLEISLWILALVFSLIIPLYLSYIIVFNYKSKKYIKILYVFLVFTPIMGIIFYFLFVTDNSTHRA